MLGQVIRFPNSFFLGDNYISKLKIDVFFFFFFYKPRNQLPQLQTGF